MAASSAASPLFPWLLASCMSVACEKEHPVRSSLFQPPRRLSQWARRGRVASRFSNLTTNYYGGFAVSGAFSIQNLMSSFFSFEPCEEFYSSINLASSSLGFFGDTRFSLFGLKAAPVMTCRQRRINRATGTDNAPAVMAEPAGRTTKTKPKHVTTKRRVVVTGMGVVTPIGHDTDVFYENLLEGVSGISNIESFDCTQFPTRIAGEIKSFSTDGWVAAKLSKRADKFMLYALTAGKKALADGGITEDVMGELDKAKCGVLIGSAMGGMKIFSDAIEALRVSYKKMNPFCVPFATTNMSSAMLALDLGWMGPNYSISSACATSNFCILNAANHIIRGESDMMLCGGSDSAIIPIGLGGFVACRALSCRNCDPAEASRPWDMNRDGFVMGEGAGVLLLEELEHAKRRGANIYGEFLGGSFTCDAYHTTEPHPEGAGIVLCIEKALAQSGVNRGDVNYVNAHASSTQVEDMKEYEALMCCFGQNLGLKINSTKSMTGHLLGAAGAIEAVATLKAIQTGWVHPNLNLKNPDQGVDENLLVGCKKERLDIKVALSNSFGFGGHNSSILFAPLK